MFWAIVAWAALRRGEDCPACHDGCTRGIISIFVVGEGRKSSSLRDVITGVAAIAITAGLDPVRIALFTNHLYLD